MNKVLLMGRLTKDPEVRYSNAAEPIAIARYSIAVNRNRRAQEGQPEADFINCVAFGKAGEFAEKWFKKGMMVSIVGRLQVSSVEDSTTGLRRWFTDVIIEEQHFAESRSSYENRSQSNVSNSSFNPNLKPPSSLNSSSNMKASSKSSDDSFFEAGYDVSDEDLPF